MIEYLNEVREKLDAVMCACIHRRVALYGNSRSGIFLKWYAKYYHNIDVDFWIRPWDVVRRTDSQLKSVLFRFWYKDIDSCVIWLSEPLEECEEDLKAYLRDRNYIEGRDYIDFWRLVYGSVPVRDRGSEEDPFRRVKGKRELQFMEFLEERYGCNYVTTVYRENYRTDASHANASRPVNENVVYPLLDSLHLQPCEHGIFDFGCGKGAALTAFLDYGFSHVGGVEYEPSIAQVCRENLTRLGFFRDGMPEGQIQVYTADARDMRTELDPFDIFYFFWPFDMEIMRTCVDRLCESLRRKPRRMRIIEIYPFAERYFLETKLFRVRSQHQVEDGRPVGIYESIL